MGILVEKSARTDQADRMGCGASAQPQTESPQNDWKMFNALDLQDEEDKFKLAKLFTFLEGEASKSREARPETNPDHHEHEEEETIEAPNIDAITVDVGYDGLVLTNPLERGTARDILQGFVCGEKLHKKFAMMVCQQALEVLNEEPNVNRLPTPSEERKIVVVGDLHGSLGDLDKMFKDHGSPGQRGDTMYVFNGDFVDRGPQGVEVMLVLLAMKVLHPKHMFLNRGNHEDKAITHSYGFEQETCTKYDKGMYDMFVKCFKRIPLCSVIGETDGVFVVHGGLFSNPDVLINDIETIKRMKYASVLSKRPPPGVQPNAKDIMIEEMLWSDPWRKKGTAPSDRGSGVMFGPDVVVNFLQKNGLKTLVRSHECMENGVERIPVSETMNMYTVFSASNYSGGDNYAAILIFTSLQHDPEIQQFRASQPPPKSKMVGSNQVKLQDLICRRHFRLLRGFQNCDANSTGLITPDVWADSMGKTLKMTEVEWKPLLPMLVGNLDDGMVDYVKFLKKHSEANKDDDAESSAMVTNLYSNYEYMKEIFTRWDVDKSGSVDREEFTNAMKLVQEHACDPEDHMDANTLFDLIDLNGSGQINLNELCEASRLSKQ